MGEVGEDEEKKRMDYFQNSFVWKLLSIQVCCLISCNVNCLSLKNRLNQFAWFVKLFLFFFFFFFVFLINNYEVYSTRYTEI